MVRISWLRSYVNMACMHSGELHNPLYVQKQHLDGAVLRLLRGQSSKEVQQLLLDRKFLSIPITHVMLYAANCGKHDGGQLLRSLLEMASSTLMSVVPMQRREPAQMTVSWPNRELFLQIMFAEIASPW